MPAALNWLLGLLITNPICMRLVQGGSRRTRHFWIRMGYLLLMTGVLSVALIGSVAAAPSVRDLARAGANTFTFISYLQVGLICLLTPVFMAGAIAQEANPRTWDILLSTPLGNLQIVLGNLLGRLFFILALLFSTLPLFAVTQYFGGVPGRSIFASYAIAGSISFLVAAIAITLCVNRAAGKRAVFWFYAIVVMYLFVTYAADAYIRPPAPSGTTGAYMTTFLTPLNPFLALDVLLRSNTYMPHDLAGTGASWLLAQWMSRPISTFCWLCVGLSVLMIGYSTLRVRLIGTRAGGVPWHRRLLGLGAAGAVERPARRVAENPIAWRESVARGQTFQAILVRWGFVACGIAIAAGLLVAFHIGVMTGPQLQAAAATLLAAEVAVIALVAINMSGTAVSHEREDGTLDLILTTPIQPGPYLAGKLRGIVQYLVPLMLVPVVTMAMLAVYVLCGGFGTNVTVSAMPGTTRITLPIVLPEGAIALPLVLVPFTAFCVMIGLYWSIKSKGTIGSVVGAVLTAGAAAGVAGLCAFPAGRSIDVLGAVMAAFTPLNLVWAVVFPALAIPSSLDSADATTARVCILVGAVLAAGAYSGIVLGMHSNMKRTFMMTVRRLAGNA
jgi:ABC-type transport system involved in multi-copper enzyme maturation permease subunit